MAEGERPCGACGELTESWHRCFLGTLDQSHDERLCSHVVCDHVCMPVDGFYFCGMGCVYEYNEFINDMVATDEVMPDGGPEDNRAATTYLMPARQRPNAPIVHRAVARGASRRQRRWSSSRRTGRRRR